MPQHSFVLTLSCEDRPGIVAAITTELFAVGANIAESNQFWDRQTGRFFMRLAFTAPDNVSRDDVERVLKPAFERFGMKTALTDQARRPKLLILVSKFDHALLHLIYQNRVGWLDAEIVAIVSNHEDSRRTAENEGIPFHYWPVTAETKAAQEEKILQLATRSGADLVVLARYMQVLSTNLATRLYGKAINIHHSFLPSFKGAKPYHQAHERGVKLIGATAHYATAELDDGPIIEQNVARVSHRQTPDELALIGRDIERVVLARAVDWHLDDRVLLVGNRTIVF